VCLCVCVCVSRRLDREIIASLADVKNWRFRCCCREIWFCPRGSQQFVRFSQRMSFFPFWIVNLSNQRLATLNLNGCPVLGSRKWGQGNRGDLGLVYVEKLGTGTANSSYDESNVGWQMVICVTEGCKAMTRFVS